VSRFRADGVDPDKRTISGVRGRARGARDRAVTLQPPRRLTQATLAPLLKAFHIRPRSIWPTGRTADSKSRKGYYRADFEAAWQAYCPRDGTPAQPNVFKLLRDD
jgi:hypothetical protein